MTKIVEIFAEGCLHCNPLLQLVRKVAGRGCDFIIHHITEKDPGNPAQRRARRLGVRTLPAVAVNGALLPGGPRGITQAQLEQAGLGSAA